MTKKEIREKFMNDIVEITLKDGFLKNSKFLKGRILDIFSNGDIRFSTKYATYYIPIEKVEEIKICDSLFNESKKLFKDEESGF